MIIAFCGHSGAGKTTVINQIKRNPCFSQREVFVRQEDDFLVLRFLKKIIGARPFEEYKKEKFISSSQTPLPKSFFVTLVNLFYPLVVYFEFLTEYFYFEILFPKKVLFRDRYPDDYWVTFKEILKIDNRLITFLYHHFPKPYLLFLLDVDLVTALRRNKNRKQGHLMTDPKMHQKVLQAYRGVAKARNLLVIDSNDSIRKTVGEVIKHLENKDKLSKARSISLSGLDGSGKTTVASLLGEYARQLNIVSRQIHFYHDNLLYKLLKKIGLTKNKKVAQVQVKKNELWAVLTFVDSLIQYFAARVFNLRKLLIFDRYFYDYLVSFDYLKLAGVNIFEKIIPRATRSYLLLVSPRKAYQRKPENVFEFYKAGYKRYKEVAKRHHLTIIDGDHKDGREIMEEMIHGL